MNGHGIEMKPLLRNQTQHDILSIIGLPDDDDEPCECRDWFIELYSVNLQSIASDDELEGVHDIVIQAIRLLAQGWPKIQRSDAHSQLNSYIDQVRRKALKKTTKRHEGIERLVNTVIDLAMRIWLMIDCREGMSTGAPNSWQPKETVQEAMTSRFHPCPEVEKELYSRFPRRFRAADLDSIGGISIQWTDFLDEHLRFDERHRSVRVFAHKEWLSDLLRAREKPQAPGSLQDGQAMPLSPPNDGTLHTTSCGVVSDIGLPAALLEETLKTLDVLFPFWHDGTCRLLDKQGKTFHLTPPFRRNTPRLSEFSYWRERLIDLIVEYESPPHDWRRAWRDRRHPMAYTTFWLGVLIFGITLVFGLIGTAFAIATWRLSVENLRIDKAQARSV